MVDVSKFKDLFILEAEDQIQRLNDGLIKLESDLGNTELLDGLMRAAHTIKGAAATMGYNNMAFLAHVMEDIFDNGRHGKIAITPDITNKVFVAIDSFEQNLGSIKDADTEIDTGVIAKELKELSGVQTEGVGKSIRSEKEFSPPVSDVSDKEGTAGVAQEESEVPEEGVKQEEGQDIEKKTTRDAMIEEAKNVFQMSHIKVSVNRLDDLVALMEELVVSKLKLESIASPLAQKSSRSAVELSEKFNPLATQLKPLVDHLSRIVSDMQYQVMQVRMIPVEQVFSRFPRMVRDLAVKEGKKVKFVVNGGDIELDRTIVDKLGEPLVHLLRNAVDHGIGKDNEEGEIMLNVTRDRNYALVVVEDNGAGVDYQKVREMVVRRGMLDEHKARELSNQQLANFLFHPQFSTREQVTEISGRGVGLSVVKTFAERVGGRVFVESPVGEHGGTRFTMRLPFSLAIIKTLLVNVGGFTFALPFPSIERSVYVHPSQVRSAFDQEVAVVDGMDVPLVRLSDILHVDGIALRQLQNLSSFDPIAPELTEVSVEGDEIPVGEKGEHAPGEHGTMEKSPNENEDKAFTVVLVQQDIGLAGVVVDSLVDEQEIVVKPLPPVLHSVRGFSGSTILGDGKTVLILDILGLLDDLDQSIETGKK